MANNNSVTKQLSNQFYRDNYPRLYRLLWMMLFGNLILVAIMVFLIINQPLSTYFASIEGKNSQLYPLSEPIVGQPALLQWATTAAISVYTYKYTDYAKVFAQAEHYFTPEGWTQFQLVNKDNLEKVIKQKLLVTAVATGAPVITEQGPLLGNYVWRISVPILVGYEGSSSKEQHHLLINMLVMRINPQINSKGIAIVQFNAIERVPQR